MKKSAMKIRAVLPDGTTLEYHEYVGDDGIPAHPHWREIREKRWMMDHQRCAFCKKPLPNLGDVEMHHLSYQRLGHEELEDIITVCHKCHELFHNNWDFVEYYERNEANHWNDFSLNDTARLCASCLTRDYWFGGNLNCCNLDICEQLVNEYSEAMNLDKRARINPSDVLLYFRNKRYEILFREERDREGFVLDTNTNPAIEAFLDEKFGLKGLKGGNRKRTEARAFTLKHTGESFHRHYAELEHINELMEETKNYE